MPVSGFPDFPVSDQISYVLTPAIAV
jgi:hypothetical protein